MSPVHDDVIKWKHFPRDWPFVRGIHRTKDSDAELWCFPSLWASVHRLVYSGMSLECHWLTQCALGYHWSAQRILAGYTGTPLEKISWNSPTLECHWTNLVETDPHWDATGQTHIVKQSSIHVSLKWQDGGTPISKWTGLCKFRFYLEFTALQWIPLLLLKHVSTSTSLCACL